jgi:hypothetical protein
MAQPALMRLWCQVVMRMTSTTVENSMLPRTASCIPTPFEADLCGHCGPTNVEAILTVSAP